MIVEKSISINALASRGWNVLVNSDITKKYMFNCEPISDWKVGSRLDWKGVADGKVYVKGIILKIEPEKLLQYTTFDPNGGLKDVPSNYLTVTYSLSSDDGGALLSVSQGDFASADNGQKRYEETETGWSMVLLKIKELAEQEQSTK
jgi:uncharacterized protein YndB with AHSA1/START domain